MKKILITLCSLSLLLLSVATAKAEAITDWKYIASAVFTNMTFSSGDVGAAGPKGTHNYLPYDTENGQESVNGFSSYQWGVHEIAASSLAVSGSAGQMTTDGDSVAGIKITHKNGPSTPYYQSLTSGTIFTTVALTSGDGQHSYTVGNALDFHYLETINGYGYDDDIFFITAAELVKSTTFVVDGQAYCVSIHTNLEALTGEYLRLAQESLGVSSHTVLYGWTIAEGGNLTTAFDLSVSISMAPPSVPVPGAVWLLGTGLAGLMACRRKVSR